MTHRLSSSVVLINPPLEPRWDGTEPVGLMVLAAALERDGHRVRILDFNVTRLDLGVLTDFLEEAAADCIGIGAVTAQAVEAYRIGRFVRASHPHTRIVYGGPHPSACPDDALTAGAGTAVIRGSALESLPRLLDGVSVEMLLDVVTRTGQSSDLTPGPDVDADTLPRPAFHLLDLSVYGRRLDLEGCWGRASVGLVTSLGPDDVHADGRRTVRAVSKVVTDMEHVASLGIDVIRIYEGDQLVDEPRLEQLCAALGESGLDVKWVGGASASSVAGCRPDLLDTLSRSGCVGVRVPLNAECAGKPELAPAAAARLKAASIHPLWSVGCFAPGEKLDDSATVAPIAYELKRGSALRRRERRTDTYFFAQFPSEHERAKNDARTTARSSSDFVPGRVTQIPGAFMEDVPVVDDRWSGHDLRAWLRQRKPWIDRWIDAGFYLPDEIDVAFPARDDYLDYVARLYELVDGRRTVRELFDSSQAAPSFLSLHCSALALLSLLRLVRGNRGVRITRVPVVVARPTMPTGRASASRSSDEGEFFCARPWTGFEVGEEDGVVRMCCWAKYGYGNVNDQTIAEIWNGPAIQGIRAKMAAGRWRETCQPECPYIAGWMSDQDPEPVASEFAANLALSRREIDERKVVLESLPRYWKAAHSTRCNLDCIMCYQDRRSKQELPESFYQDLAAYYPVMQELLLMGGEPLAIKQTRSMLETFPTEQCPDLHFSLITNGTVFDKKTQALIRRAPLSWVVVSIDAARPETYSHIRRGGKLAKTLDGVMAWKLLSQEQGFPLVLSYTVMRDNIAELADFAALSSGRGVDCQFTRVNGTKADQHLIDERRLQREIDRALDFISREGLQGIMPIAHESLVSLRARS